MKGIKVNGECLGEQKSLHEMVLEVLAVAEELRAVSLEESKRWAAINEEIKKELMELQIRVGVLERIRGCGVKA